MTAEDTITEVVEICECLSYAPKTDGFVRRFAMMLAAMIGDALISTRGKSFTPAERLAWITDVMIEDLGKWPEDGLQEVRAIYCNYFKPADGKEPAKVSELAEHVRPPAPQPPVKAFMPGPGDEPIGELTKLIESAAEAKKGNR